MTEHRSEFRSARKGLGQNFLHEQGVIRAIIDLVQPVRSDIFVEIGPGRGALTYPLLESVDELHVVELDNDLARHWLDAASSEKGLHVHHTDILGFDLAQCDPGGRGIRVVGNLPYNISSPIVIHLLSQADRIRDMHLMFQLEVAERLSARPGGRQYGRLSVMVQQRFSIETVLRVSRGAFTPVPGVDSAVARLVPLESPLVPVELQAEFAEVVRCAFSRRRKTLRNALRGLLSAEAISSAGVDPGLRPEQLGAEEYCRLALILRSQNTV